MAMHNNTIDETYPLAVLVVDYTTAGETWEVCYTDDMTVYQAIRQRRTIRRFTQDPVPPAVLMKLVEAARLAPSGGNLQPWEFIIVQGKDLVAEVFGTLGWAGYIAPRGNPPAGERPTAYIVVLQNKEIKVATPCADLAAAIENMLLLAVEEGLGSCWIGSIKRERLATLLGIPSTHLLDSVIALGYPNEDSVTEECRESSIRYWKDDAGVMHIPKRNLTEILHQEKYLTKEKDTLK